MNCFNCKKYAYVCVECGNIHDSCMISNIFTWFNFMAAPYYNIKNMNKRYIFNDERMYYEYVMKTMGHK